MPNQSKLKPIVTSSQSEQDFIKSLEVQNYQFTDFLSFCNNYLDKIVAFNASI
jgi:hypothetical protein